MKNAVDNLKVSAYQMSDEELMELSDRVYQNNKKILGITDPYSISYETEQELTDCLLTIPLTKEGLKALVITGFYNQNELEDENRRLYAERGWEKYL